LTDSSIIPSHPFGITVVIPTFNRQQTLIRAIESVVTFNTNLVEIIVVDDGSAQDQRLFIPNCNGSGVPLRSFRFDYNRGPQAARNLGIRRARFSHIAFLDSDDAFTPEKIDIVLQALSKNSVDILFHAVAGMPKYGRLARLWSIYLRKIIPFQWWIAIYNPVVTPALIVKRRVRLGVPRMRHCEDWFFLLRYAEPDMCVEYLENELSTVFRSPGTTGGLSGAVWKMRKGEFLARAVLLKSLTIWSLIRYVLGGGVGVLRVLNDLFRGKYWRSF
jgi:glycosyltransferase involved in cell wall biosynthesis